MRECIGAWHGTWQAKLSAAMLPSTSLVSWYLSSNSSGLFENGAFLKDIVIRRNILVEV